MLFAMAKLLPNALPPMVRPEVRAVTAREITMPGIPKAVCICTTITAPVEPEMMPQMSPKIGRASCRERVWTYV